MDVTTQRLELTIAYCEFITRSRGFRPKRGRVGGRGPLRPREGPSASASVFLSGPAPQQASGAGTRRRSVRQQTGEEHGGVVVQAAAAVVEQVLVQALQQLPGRQRPPGPDAVHERVEGAAGIAGLGDA